LTAFEIGVSGTKIIIPSFKTTSKLFAQHFQILRELNHKLQLLKKSMTNKDQKINHGIKSMKSSASSTPV